MALLEIKKYSNGTFAHTLDGDYANSIIDNSPNTTSFGDKFNFKTKNGANIIKKQFITLDEITYIDVDDNSFTFASVQDVWVKLIDEEYFKGLNQSSGGSGSERFDGLLDTFSYIGNNGKVPVVDQAQLKLVPTVFYNFNEFKQLEDVDINAFVANKLIGVNIAGDKIVLIDPPADPVQLANTLGYFLTADLATQTTPINYTTGTIVLPNDGLGVATTSLFRPFGVSQIWNSITNRFDFSELSVGDEIILRVDLKLTTTMANQSVKIDLVIGEGTADELTFRVTDKFYESIVTDESLTASIPFFLGTSDRVTAPGKLLFSSEGNDDCTIKIGSWFTNVIRKGVNIIDINIDGNTDDLSEGITNLYFTTARVLATLLTGISFATGGAIVSTDSILIAFGKLQKQVSDNLTAIGLKQDILTDVNLGSFINGLTGKTTPVDADYSIYMDSADSNKAKKVSWLNIKATLKTYYDTLYQVVLVSGTNIKTVGGTSLLGSGNISIDTQLYATIAGNTTLDDTYHSRTVYVTATSTITIPSGLRADFNASFRTFTGVTATFAASGTTINSESDTSVIIAKKMCYLSVYSTNNYIISGGA